MALWERLKREVAVKVIPAARTRDPEVRHQFFCKARAVAALSNDHCVRLFDYGEGAASVLCMVLELIRGQTLNDALRDAGAVLMNAMVDGEANRVVDGHRASGGARIDSRRVRAGFVGT